MRHLLLLLAFVPGGFAEGVAQYSQARDTFDRARHEYHVNYKVSIPGIVAGAALGIIGQERIRRKDDITLSELMSLDRTKVPGIDRVALRQDLDRVERALEISDFGITYTTLLPALLFIDNRMRKDWLDVTLVYVESQVAVMNIYSWSFLGPTFIERYRPVAYYDALLPEDRIWGGNRNSFYSGHVSTVSTWSFFMARSYLDYHPEVTALKWAIYGAAAIPPAFVGIKRVQGLKHFPTDVIVGYLIGAAGGIFWPELHKGKRDKSLNISILYEPEMKCISLSHTF